MNNVMNEKVKMMSIKDLSNYSFIIPSFQRGLRWNRQQMKELLSDLYEFVNSAENNSVYCLQPIIINEKADGVFEVIDGQQRLTALWLVYQCFKISDRYQSSNLDFSFDYIITYENKSDYNNLLKQIKDSANQISKKVNCSTQQKIELFLNNLIVPKDIDCKNLENLIRFILIDYYCPDYRNNYKFDVVFERILMEISQSRKNIDIQFIWDYKQNELLDNTIEKFINVNANKIPLTEAELIKAHLLSISKDEDNIALRWEEIEKGLNNDKFWYFFARDDKNYETRIDILFDIWYMDNNIGNKENGTHVISKSAITFMNIYPETFWNKIVWYYETLLDWFNDYFLYHVIGLYIELNYKRSTAESIVALFDIYKKEPVKSNFNQKILKMITKISSSNGETFKKRNESIFTFNQQVNKYTNIDLSLNYEDDYDTIKSILLLFNIALLINSQQVTLLNTYERFPFDYYKNKNNPIEIEHINPQKPSEEENFEKWKSCTIQLLSDSDKARFNDISKNDETKLKDLEAVAGIHNFNNLTLMDKKLNIGYSNYSLDDKRKHLLSALFGLPKPKKTIDEEEQYYRESVILPGTRWVFLKEYSSNNELDNSDCRWEQIDKEIYEKNVIRSILTFLNGGDDNE